MPNIEFPTPISLSDSRSEFKTKGTHATKLFQSLDCCDETISSAPINTANIHIIMQKLDQNKMMTHILDCLEALRVVQTSCKEFKRDIIEVMDEKPIPCILPN